MNQHTVLQSSKLPKGWIKTSLDSVGKITSGSPAPQGEQFFKNGKYFFVRVADMGKLKSDYLNEIKDRINEIGSKNLRLFSKGSVLFTKSGASTHLNQKAILGMDSYVVSHIGIIRTFGKIPSEWIYYFLKTIDFKSLTHSTTLPSLNLSTVKDLQIRIPPLNEQIRIVSKIKKSINEIDTAKKSIKETEVKIKQYRQSLLKSAFTGDLTKKWRDKNKTNLDNVLKKIELGRKNQDKKLQNIKQEKVNDFFHIPKEWKWIKVGMISKETQYGTGEKATTTKSKIPVLRMGNIQDGELDFENLKYFPDNWKDIKKFLLEDGDVLFNRTNSAELVGKTAVYRNNYPVAVFAGYLIRVKIIDDTYIPSLLSNFINSIYGRIYINSVVTQQVGQANVNSTKLSMIPLPLMSIEEQKEIISKIDLGFSLIKNAENLKNTILTQLETLQSSILKKAFEGKLVPQDPNDEPASILLERIIKEKT